MKFFFAVLTSLVLITQGCDNSFSPKQDYKERIVVFAVLSNTEPYQTVRLESTFDAELTNPDQPATKRSITEASVSISAMVGRNNRTFVFTDTILSLAGGAEKKVWISRELIPTEGAVYTLKVQVPALDPISAEVKVPSRSYVAILPPDANQNRFGTVLSAGAISTQAPPKGFYFRMWVIGTKLVNGTEVEIRREVPFRIDPVTRDTTFTKPGRESAAEFITDFIAGIKSDMVNLESAFDFHVVGTAYALDTYMYNYFQTVRGFDDPVSVRQDRPDVTNILNGVGILGAITADSIRLPYAAVVISK